MINVPDDIWSQNGIGGSYVAIDLLVVREKIEIPLDCMTTRVVPKMNFFAARESKLRVPGQGFIQPSSSTLLRANAKKIQHKKLFKNHFRNTGKINHAG